MPSNRDPVVIDLTKTDDPPNRPRGFNPASELNLTRAPKRPRTDNRDEITITGYKRPSPIIISDGPSHAPSKKKHRADSGVRRDGHASGSSRSQSLSTTGTRTSTPSMPRPAPVVPKHSGEVLYISSDSDEEEVNNMVRVKSVTPAQWMPLPAYSNAAASTSRAPPVPAPPRPPPTRFGPSLFHNLQHTGIQDRETLDCLTIEEYENLLPPFDDTGVWKPIKSNPNALQHPSPEHDVPMSEDESESDESEDEAEKSEGLLSRFKRPDFVYPQPTLGLETYQGVYLTRDFYQSAESVDRRNIPRFRNRPTSLLGDCSYWRSPLEKELHLDRLRVTESFKQCPGSIICVQQCDGYVAIAGACTGGMEDDPTETAPDPYNRAGSFITFSRRRKRRTVILPGHINPDRFPGPHKTKYYGLTDVKFCPTDPSQIVTSGNDKMLRVWQQEPVEPWYNEDVKRTKWATVPNSLLFKPGTRTLAVAESTISILRDVNSSLEQKNWSRLDGVKNGQVVGEMRWGVGSTEGFLFASSEPIEDKKYTGSWHRIYDVEYNRARVELDTTEAGDAMALDTLGDRLAIVTRTSRTDCNLRMFDVRTRDRRPTMEIQLEPFELRKPGDEDEEGEHQDAQFSPDGVFIALARYDNRVHVYDSRFMKTSGVLYDFKHGGAPKTNPGLQPCGVPQLEWAWKGARMGLLSGGSDGCVRLWDPLVAADDESNGRAVATVNSDIASFSLGDRFRGEHQLVIGDCAGEVTIFDQFLDEDFPYT